MLGLNIGVAASLAAGLIVTVALWRTADIKKHEAAGVAKEQSRVETAGRKIDAKAATARRAAESQPHDSLRQYYRD